MNGVWTVWTSCSHFHWKKLHVHTGSILLYRMQLLQARHMRWHESILQKSDARDVARDDAWCQLSVLSFSRGLILRTGNVVETGQSKFQEESIPCTPLVSHNVTWNWRIKWQLFNLTMGSGKTRSRCGIILQHRIVNLATERCHKTFRCQSHVKHPSIKLRSQGNKTCLAFGCIVAVQTFNFLP